MNLLAEILLTMQGGLTGSKRSETATDAPQPHPRFEILKTCPDGFVSIGAVRGVEYAQRVLTCLNSLEKGPYFLYEISFESARKA
jgi:hypothetical protein